MYDSHAVGLDNAIVVRKDWVNLCVIVHDLDGNDYDVRYGPNEW